MKADRYISAESGHAGELRDDLQRYLNLTGLTLPDFARRINYSSIALYKFVQKIYPGNTAHLCDAVKDFIAAHPVALTTEMEGKLYETGNVRKLRSVFYDCLDKQRAGLVYGGPGSQKTFALEHLIAELNRKEVAKSARAAYYV